MKRVAIVENEKPAQEVLSDYTKSYAKSHNEEIEVVCFSNGFDFLEAYEKQPFDVVFMDIVMPLFDGLEVAHNLRHIDPYVSLIFVTNMAKYAVNGYEVGALDFLIKPVQYLNFSIKLERALQRKPYSSGEKVILDSTEGAIVVALDDVLYIESNDHYLTYHTVNGDYVVRGTLDTVEKELSEKHFVRCHRVFVVNMKYVEKVQANTVVVKGVPVALGRSKKDLFMKRLTAYYGREH